MRRALLLAALLAWAAPATAAERIVSLGGSVTEILFALGLSERIVAVDSTSLYPPEARELPDVGYLRQLSAEPILALSPDLVIGTEDAGPAAVIEQLVDAGATVVIVADLPSPDGVLAKIRTVAEAVGESAAGEALAAKVEAEFDALATKLATLPERPSVLFLLSASGGAPLAAGQDTAAESIIALAGGRNAVRGYSGYKPLSPEVAATLDPELVMISDHAVLLLGGMEGLAARADLGLLPAVQEGRILVLDANLLLGFGPRAPVAASLVAERLHPSFAGQSQ